VHWLENIFIIIRPHVFLCIGVRLDHFYPKDWHTQDVLDCQVLRGVFRTKSKDQNNSAEKSMMIFINLFFKKLCDRTEKVIFTMPSTRINKILNEYRILVGKPDRHKARVGVRRICGHVMKWLTKDKL